jgi:hypothetical protein
MEIGSVWVRFGVKLDEWNAGMGKVKTDMTAWRDQTNASTGDMAKWGAAIVAQVAPVVAVGAAFYASGKHAADFGMEIKDNSRMLGISQQAYQQWRHVATATDVDIQSLTTNMRMLTTRMADADNVTTDIGRAYKELGIEVKDTGGHFRSTDQIFMDVIVKLGQMQDPVLRNQMAIQMFGRSWQELAPMIGLSRDELQKLIDQAPVFSDEKINKMAKMKTEVGLLNEKLDTMYITIGEKTIPILSRLVTGIDAAFSTKQADDFFDKLTEGLDLIGKMDDAYRALARGGVKEFFEAAGQAKFEAGQKAILEAIPDTEYGNKWNRYQAQISGTANYAEGMEKPPGETVYTEGTRTYNKIVSDALYGKTGADLQAAVAKLYGRSDINEILGAGVTLTAEQIADYTSGKTGPSGRVLVQPSTGGVGAYQGYIGSQGGQTTGWIANPTDWYINPQTGEMEHSYEYWMRENPTWAAGHPTSSGGIGGVTIGTININSPQGTPAQNAAAVQRALRDLGDNIISSGG